MPEPAPWQRCSRREVTVGTWRRAWSAIQPPADPAFDEFAAELKEGRVPRDSRASDPLPPPELRARFRRQLIRHLRDPGCTEDKLRATLDALGEPPDERIDEVVTKLESSGLEAAMAMMEQRWPCVKGFPAASQLRQVVGTAVGGMVRAVVKATRMCAASSGLEWEATVRDAGLVGRSQVWEAGAIVDAGDGSREKRFCQEDVEAWRRFLGVSRRAPFLRCTRAQRGGGGGTICLRVRAPPSCF